MTMKEIPIFFPNNITDLPPRYVVDYRASCLAMTSQNAMSTVDSLNDDVHVVDEALTEAASVSEVQLQGKNFLVTTSALVDQPEVISVALFPTGGNNQLGAPKTVELNTGDLVVVSARAVSIDSTSFKAAPLSPPLFRLVLVGSQGIIVSLALDENLVPDMANPLKVLFPEEYVPVALQSHITSTLLRPTMVEFLSSKRHHIVIALSPSLMIVDWMNSGKCEVWTESQCREDMKSRQRILDFSNFAFGRIDNGVVDMAPTAAVCVSSNKPKGNEGTDVVFTIHSDASIRKWLVDTDKSLRPFHVCTKIAKELPSPSTWNDARNSVAMSARLYGQTFALGLYIKTNSILEGESACNIWAFNGQITSSFDESLELWIPNDVQNVVSMAFNPTDPRCSLCAVFEYSKGTSSQNKSGIHVVMYPHDHIVIVGSQPEFMTTDSLDQIAAVERDRINALSYGETVLADFDEEESSPSVDEALNAVDALHLKFLFRPMFPRGNGTVLPPSDSCIRRALSKLVSNYRREQGMSIELETIKTLYEWRKRDKYRERISSFTNNYGRNATNSSQPMLESVYESYVRISREEEPKEEICEEIVIEGQTENGLLTEIETHQNRWRQLLRQIWEEEHILRLPLHVAWLNGYGLPVMLRGGVSSILTPPSQRRMANPLYLELDDACSRILSCIEADPSKSRYLYNIEGRVATYVSRFLLKPYPQSSIEDDLTCLGRWAAYKQGDLQNLRNALVAATTAGEILDWVRSNPQELLFSSDLDLNVFGPTDAGEFPNIQLRQAACTSLVRTVDAIRRAQLGKCLLLSALGTEGFVDKVALRRYMSVISVLWTSSQQLNMSVDANNATIHNIHFHERSVLPLNSSDPSFGNPPSGVLRPHNPRTTVLDADVISLANDPTASNYQSMFPWAVAGLVEVFTSRVFPDKGKGTDSLPPELSALPNPGGCAFSFDYSGLALRLLAPMVEFCIPEDSSEMLMMRTREMARCLLEALRKDSFPPNQKRKMLQLASQLLSPQAFSSRNDLNIVLMNEGLAYLSQLSSGTDPSDGRNLQALVRELLPTSTSAEVSDVLELECSRRLLSRVENIDEESRPLLQAVAEGFLLISRVHFRIHMFEKLITNGDSLDPVVEDSYYQYLIDVTSCAISEIREQFPESFLVKSNEYRSLWATKLKFAIRSARWNEAYDACFQRPLEPDRENNLGLLVKAMVDQGGLLDLIRLCRPFRSGESGDITDLYPIACEVLLHYSAEQDNYEARASSSGIRAITDYQGALYALHASQLQWQRAAQAMSLRYEKAVRCFRTRKDSFIANLKSTLIVDDLVLSSTAAANATMLVKEPMARFVTTGEYGWYSAYVPNNPGLPRNNSNHGGDDGEDDTYYYRGAVHLKTSSFRAIGLRTAYFDGCVVQSKVIETFCSNVSVLKDTERVIALLFDSGYYQKGLILALKMCEQYNEKYGRMRGNGLDTFAVYVADLLKSWLIPRSFEVSNGSKLRPTLNQLQIANDSFGKTSRAPFYAATSRSHALASLPGEAIAAALSTFVRKLTCEFSTAETPIALEVAECILRQNDAARLPVWLERLLLAADAEDSINGAFAPRRIGNSQEYLGNPQGLLSLYINESLFCEASDLVASVLNRHCTRIQNADKETRRLPSEGDIDYVPYDLIDTLYNLIQVAIDSSECDNEEKEKMQKARERMEKALLNYSKLLQNNEDGLNSARLLETY